MTALDLKALQEAINQKEICSYRGDNELNFQPFNKDDFFEVIGREENTFTQYLSNIDGTTTIGEVEKVGEGLWTISEELPIVKAHTV